MTADAGFVCASRRPQRAGDANCRRCNSIAADAMPARSIGLPRPATVKRCSTRGARNSIPEHSETTSVTICRELSDSDQIIKSEHQWDRSTAFLRARTAPRVYARDTTPVWSAWAEGRHDRRRRVCLRQQTTATGWRRQLPAVQFNRSRRDAGALDRLAEASDGETVQYSRRPQTIKSEPVGQIDGLSVSTRGARNSIPEHSETTLSPSAAN